MNALSAAFVALCSAYPLAARSASVEPHCMICEKGCRSSGRTWKWKDKDGGAASQDIKAVTFRNLCGYTDEKNDTSYPLTHTNCAELTMARCDIVV